MLIVWRKDGEDRDRVYKIWRRHSKGKYMEALVGEQEVKVNRF